MPVKITFLESFLWGEIHTVFFFWKKNLIGIKRRENTTCCYLKEQFIQGYSSINIEEFDLYEFSHMTKNNILYYI